MKYPKFTREENKRCKLSDSDIASIRKMRAEGHTLKEIALEFDVSQGTIHYWLLDDDGREKMKEKIAQNAKPGKYNKGAYLRKMELHPEIREYWREKKGSKKVLKKNGQIRMFNIIKERKNNE